MKYDIEKINERMGLWQKKYLSYISVLPESAQLIYIIAMDATYALDECDSRAQKLEHALLVLLGIVEDYIPDMSEFIETDEWRDAWYALSKK